MDGIGKWLRIQLAEQQIKQTELSRDAGVNIGTINGLVRGRRVGIRVDTLELILDALDAHLEIAENGGRKRWKI